jgi:hypothetical protein
MVSTRIGVLVPMLPDEGMRTPGQPFEDHSEWRSFASIISQ